MMFPFFKKLLNLFMKFGRNRNYFLFPFNPKAKKINGVFFSPLTSLAGWLSTRTARQRKRTFHHIRQFFEKPLLFCLCSHESLFTSLHMSTYTESIAKDMCLSRECGKIFNFYSGCQGKCWFFKRGALSSPAIVLGGGSSLVMGNKVELEEVVL